MSDKPTVYVEILADDGPSALQLGAVIWGDLENVEILADDGPSALLDARRDQQFPRVLRSSPTMDRRRCLLTALAPTDGKDVEILADDGPSALHRVHGGPPSV